MTPSSESGRQVSGPASPSATFLANGGTVPTAHHDWDVEM